MSRRAERDGDQHANRGSSLGIDAAVAAPVFAVQSEELGLRPHVPLRRQTHALRVQLWNQDVLRTQGQDVLRVVLLVTGNTLPHRNLCVSGDMQIGEPEHVHDVPVGAVLEYADSKTGNLVPRARVLEETSAQALAQCI